MIMIGWLCIKQNRRLWQLFTTMLVRLLPHQETTNLYSGKFGKLPFANTRDIIRLETECALWCFEFSDDKTYLGVFDVDFELSSEEVDILLHRQIPDQVKTVIDMFEQVFEGTAMKVWYSGKKGVHVYVQDPRLMVQRTTKNQSIEYLSSILGETLMKHIDQSVYGLRSGIRPYTCAHPKTKVTPMTLKVCNGFDDEDFWDFLSQAPVFQVLTGDIVMPSQPKTTQPKHIIVHREGQVMDNVCAALQEHQQNLDRVDTERFTKFTHQTYCFIAQRSHRRPKCYWKIYEHHAEMKCFSFDCRAGTYIIKTQAPPVTRIPDVYRQKCKAIETLPESTVYVPSSSIAEAFQTSNILLITSPMGTGKTYAFNEYCKQQTHKRVCMLVTRKCQANYFSKRFHMTNYLASESKSLYDEERVVVCLNSLPRVLAKDGAVPCFDYLLLDEIESLVKCLTNPCLNTGPYKQQTIWNLFVLLIKCSKHTVMMDGLPSEALYHFLDMIHVLPHMHCIEHMCQPDQRRYEYIKNPYIFRAIFKKSLGQGMKSVFVSTGKGDMNVFCNLVREQHKCFLIDGDSSDEIKGTSSDPNKNWIGYDVLFYNGAVGPGASFEEVYYDEMFVYIEPGLADPTELYQLINRIRNLKNNRVYFYIKKVKAKMPKSEAELKLQACTNITRFSYIQKKLGSRFMKQGEPHTLVIDHEDPKVLRQLASENQLVLCHENDDFLNAMVKALYYRLYYHDRKRYYKAFTQLITRNGGIVREQQQNVSENLERAFNAHMLLQNKTSVVERGTYLASKEEFTEDEMRVMHDLVNLGDTDKQKIFCRLKKAMSEEDVRVYEREFSDVNHGKVLNNTLLYTQLVYHFRAILDIFGLQYDKETGYIQGEFCTQDALGNAEAFDKHAAKIIELISREHPCKDYEPVVKGVKGYYTMKHLFNQLGYHMSTSRKQRKMMNGDRKQVSYFRITKLAVDIRNRLADKNHVALHETLSANKDRLF